MNESISQKVENYCQAKDELDFFDINLWWDPVHTQCFNRTNSFADFHGSLRQNSIKKAVLTHAECNKYEPKIGNESLKVLIEGTDNLYGAMVLTADHLITGENIIHYIDSLVESRFVLVRLFPRLHHHSIRPGVLGDVFKHLEKRRIPLMLWHAETSWEMIESLCETYPKLPVVLEGNDVKLLYHNRFYVPLFRKLANLYLETHNVILFKEIDVLASINPEKLLFGSYSLYNNPDTAMAPIIFGNMGQAAKQLIAHGNLERLIHEIR